MNKFDIKKNPITEEYLDITEAIEANEGYCCCALEKTEDTKCMCKKFRDSENTDFCHCGRYYKVIEYETLALVGDISDYTTQENYIDWYERLIYQNFIVLGVPLNLHDFHCGSEEHFNLCKTIIAKADAVVVLGHNQKLYSMIADLIEWADSIGKKVLTREDLVK
jgi:hypothetical protein